MVGYLYTTRVDTFFTDKHKKSIRLSVFSGDISTFMIWDSICYAMQNKEFSEQFTLLLSQFERFRVHLAFRVPTYLVHILFAWVRKRLSTTRCVHRGSERKLFLLVCVHKRMFDRCIFTNTFYYAVYLLQMIRPTHYTEKMLA